MTELYDQYDPLKGVRDDREGLRKRILLSIALRHPHSATWARTSQRSRERIAPPIGGKQIADRADRHEG